MSAEAFFRHDAVTERFAKVLSHLSSKGAVAEGVDTAALARNAGASLRISSPSSAPTTCSSNELVLLHAWRART